MTTGLLFALASALVLVYVLLPLTRRRSSAAAPPTWSTNGRFRGLEEQRATALEALRDLEFEFQLGNLTEEDYHRLRERFSRRAIVLLQAVEAADRQLDDEIEEAVQALHTTRPRAEPASPAARFATSCPTCGTLARPNDRFCAACGNTLGGTTSAATRPAPARGASPPQRAQGKPARIVVPRWALVSGVVALAFVVAVGALYFQLSTSAAQVEPVGKATVSHVHGMLVSPQVGNPVFLSHHDGLQVSRESGRTWSAVPGVQGDVMGLVSHPAAPSTVYATGHNVVLKSPDGGQTWGTWQLPLPGLDIHAFTGHPNDPQTLYAFVVEHGLFRTADGGATWSLLTTQAPVSTYGIAVVPNTPEWIYLATQDQGVLFSGDGGKAWSNASGFVNGALPTKQVFAVVYDPKSGDRFESGGGTGFTGALYIGTDRGVFKSVDGGQSWNGLPLRVSVAALALDPIDSRIIVAADATGQVYRSTDRGLTWRAQ